MYLKTLRLSEIHPYERNPRINDNAIQPVMESIQKDGYRARIIVDANGVIIAGHTRYKALQNLGWNEVEVWVADDMSEEQIRDYRVRDNYTAGFAEWDFDLLPGEIEGLDFDMGMFGSSDDGEHEEPPEPETVEDNFDPEEDVPEEVTDIQRGDVFILGNHHVMCGDSADANDVLTLIGGAKADLFLTDPPYNVDYAGKQKDQVGRRINHRVDSGDATEIENDAMDNDVFVAFMMRVFRNAGDAMRPGAAFYIFHPDIYGHLFRQAVIDTGWNLRQILVWVKNNMVLSRMDYHYRHEPVLYGWKPGGAHYFIDSRKQQSVFDDRIDIKQLSKQEMRNLLEKIYADAMPTTVLYEDKPLVNDIHPTMKPIKLMARLIVNSSRSGDAVLDLFGGSGSTMMACEQLGRSCYTMEVAPTYVQAMLRRYAKFTGKPVYRLIDGKPVEYDTGL